MPELITIVAYIATAVLAVVAGWLKWNYNKTIKEVVDVILSLKDALEDGKITKEELDKIVKEAKEAFAEIKATAKLVRFK